MIEQKQLDFTSISSVMVESQDICANRHRNNPESNAAHEQILNEKLEAYNRIMAIYVARKEYGATSHEISWATGMPLQTVSARLSELHHKLNKLEKKGERRHGAAVLVEAGMGYVIQGDAEKSV